MTTDRGGRRRTCQYYWAAAGDKVAAGDKDAAGCGGVIVVGVGGIGGIVVVIAVVAVEHGLEGIFSVYTGGLRGHAGLVVSGGGRGSSHASAPLTIPHPYRLGSGLAFSWGGGCRGV